MELAALARIETRLERLEQQLSTMTELLGQLPAWSAAAVDVVDDAAGNAARRGVDIDGRMRTAIRLVDRLTEPGTAASVERVLSRVEALEPATAALAEAPAVLATVTDVADRAVARAATRGIDVDARLKNSAALVETLTRPEVTESLDRVLTRIEAIEPAIQAVADAPALVATVTDAVDGAVRTAAHEGIDVDARAHAAIGLVRQLSEPKTLATLERLLARIHEAEPALNAVLQAPAALAAATDALDEAAGRMAQNGAPLDDRLRALTDVLVRATEPETLRSVSALLDRADRIPVVLTALEGLPGGLAALVDVADDLLPPERVAFIKRASEAVGRLYSPNAVELVSRIGDALAATEATKPKAVGPWATITAIWDKDVRAAVGFALEFARHLGRTMGESRTPIETNSKAPARLSA